MNRSRYIQRVRSVNHRKHAFDKWLTEQLAGMRLPPPLTRTERRKIVKRAWRILSPPATPCDSR